MKVFRDKFSMVLNFVKLGVRMQKIQNHPLGLISFIIPKADLKISPYLRDLFVKIYQFVVKFNFFVSINFYKDFSPKIEADFIF